MGVGKERLNPLRTEYNLLASDVAEPVRDIDSLQSDHALRDQDLHRLSSSLAASAEELALL